MGKYLRNMNKLLAHSIRLLCHHSSKSNNEVWRYSDDRASS